MSWLTRISLRNRSLVALAVVAVIIVGVLAVNSLKMELIPDLTFPYITVFTVAPGTSTGDVERGITTPLEAAIKTTGGIKEFDSYSNEGMSIITVQYEFGADMAARQSELQQAVSGVQQVLPVGAQPPKVERLNFNTMPVVQLAVSSSLPPEQLATLLGTKVVPRLQGITGVQAVTLSGVQQMQLQIRLKPKAAARYRVSPVQIMAAVQQANLTQGAGAVTSGSLVYPVTLSASAQTMGAFRRLVVSTSGASAGSATTAAASAASGGGAASPSATAAVTTAAASTLAASSGTVRLADVADVRIAPAPLDAVTRTNGKASIGISISKASSGNTVDIADAVAKELPAIKRDLGGKATITTVVDQSTYIKESISSLLRDGLIGAVFAVLVILIFLRSWRSTVVAGVSIPLSVIVALILLWRATCR